MMRSLASVLAPVLVCVLTGSALAKRHDSYPTEGGIWLNQGKGRGCPAEFQQQVLASLRRITGLQKLRFTKDNGLKVEDWDAIAGGSETARMLLLNALESGDAFLVENHSGSTEVTFGQLSEGLIYEAGSQHRLTIWNLRLDLDDFKRISAPTQVLASFDVGFAFLHELLHGLGYEDPASSNQIGECEEVINQIRDDLGLPLREQYYGEAVQITPQVITVRLNFRDAPLKSPSKRQSKRRTYQLFFAPEIEAHPRIIEELTNQNFLRRH